MVPVGRLALQRRVAGRDALGIDPPDDRPIGRRHGLDPESARRRHDGIITRRRLVIRRIGTSSSVDGRPAKRHATVGLPDQPRPDIGDERKMRKLLAGLVLSGTILAVAVPTVAAHECFIVNRSDQGTIGADHSGRWDKLPLGAIFGFIHEVVAGRRSRLHRSSGPSVRPRTRGSRRMAGSSVATARSAPAPASRTARASTTSRTSTASRSSGSTSRRSPTEARYLRALDRPERSRLAGRAGFGASPD